MRKISFTIVLLLMMLNVFSQQKKNYAIGVNIGVNEFDNFGPLAYAFELELERTLGKGFSIAISYGHTNQNDIPKFYENTQQFINGVPPNIDDYILSLTPNSAFNLYWHNYNVNYLNFSGIYELPFSIFKTKLQIVGGLFISHYTYSLFYLDEFSHSPTSVISYTPQYQIGNKIKPGWIMGGGIKRSFMPNWDFFARYKLNILFNDESFAPSFISYHTGIKYNF